MKPQNLHAHEDRLLDFVYGELPVPEAKLVEAHLQGCARCTQALDDIRGVRATMSQLSQEPAPDAGLESLLEMLALAAAADRPDLGRLLEVAGDRPSGSTRRVLVTTRPAAELAAAMESASSARPRRNTDAAHQITVVEAREESLASIFFLA